MLGDVFNAVFPYAFVAAVVVLVVRGLNRRSIRRHGVGVVQQWWRDINHQ